MLVLQILIDGFAISSLCALGATGFTLIFGVSGVFEPSHGALMVTAAVAAWAASSVLQLNTYAGALVGVFTALVAAIATYFIVVQPIQRSRSIPSEEKEIFVLTATLLWGIMLQELIAYFFTNNAEDGAALSWRALSISSASYAAERNLHCGRLLRGDWASVVACEPHAHR